MGKAFACAGKYTARLQRALERLDSLVDWERKSRVRGAQRMMRVDAGAAHSLVERLGVDLRKFTAVHVTGSKGKGTVCALIEAGVGAERVGVLGSPHVERVNERLRLRGTPVQDDTFADALERTLQVRAAAPTIANATWFDVVTVAALDVIARERLPYAVIEAGMGARRDSTAVVDAHIAVVTNVMHEHADIIGPTRADIAHEKAGAVRPGTTLVLGLRDDDPVAHVFHDEAASLIPPAKVVHVPPPPGGVRAHNVALARAALHALGDANTVHSLDDAAVDRALASLPARMERFTVPCDGSDVNVLLDGAHVAYSVTAVLNEYCDNTEDLVLVLGVGADKDADAIARAVHNAGVRKVFATAAGQQPVYLTPIKMAEALRNAGYTSADVGIVDDATAALNAAVSFAAENGRNVAVVGSLHLAGAVRPALREATLGRGFKHPSRAQSKG